jgi:hypothetical protein
MHPKVLRQIIEERLAADLAEEVDNLLGPRQTAEIAVNDHAVEAVVYQE